MKEQQLRLKTLMPTPAIIRAIAERVDTYFSLGNVTVVTLNNSQMRSLNVRSVDSPNGRGVVEFQGYLNLLDFTDLWVKAITYSLQDNVFDLSRVFLKLMELEATLRWEGLFRRKPIFVVHPRVPELMKQLPELRINTGLTKEFNDDRELMDKITSTKPLRIEIKLMYFLSYFSNNARHRRTDEREALLQYATNPDKIIWEIHLLLPLLRKGESVDEGKAMCSLEVMDALADKIVEGSRSLITSL
jgi:hypothetical protein